MKLSRRQLFAAAAGAPLVLKALPAAPAPVLTKGRWYTEEFLIRHLMSINGSRTHLEAHAWLPPYNHDVARSRYWLPESEAKRFEWRIRRWMRSPARIENWFLQIDRLPLPHELNMDKKLDFPGAKWFAWWRLDAPVWRGSGISGTMSASTSS